MKRKIIAIIIVICFVMTPVHVDFSDTSTNGITVDLETADAASSSKTIQGVKNTTIKVSGSYVNNVTSLSWTKSKGYSVDKYIIYRANSKNGTYKPIGGILEGWYEFKDITGMTKGKTYYYKVRGMRNINGNEYYTKYSNVVAMKAKVNEYSWNSPEMLDLEDIFDEANEERASKLNDLSISEGVGTFKTEIYSSGDLLTEKELDSLLKNNKGKSKLTNKQAKEDINLFFNAYKYAFTGYDYFGGDKKFEAQRNKALNSIEGKKTVTKTELQNILYKYIKFINDGHVTVGGKILSENSKSTHYVFQMKIKEPFNKDEKGYYKSDNGTKWYYSHNSSKDVDAFFAPFVTSTGEISYYLMCLTADIDSTSVNVTLKNGNKTRVLKGNWIHNPAIGNTGLKNFSYEEKNGTATIRIGNFTDYSAIQAFIDTAYKARKQKNIILDLRSNGGGSFEAIIQWIEIFTGERPEIKSAHFMLRTGLVSKEYYDNESYDYSYSEGKIINNEIPVIVLVDDLTVSAAEEVVCYLRTMNNVLVVGTNTAGGQLAKERVRLSLPNSGINFDIGYGLQFAEKLEVIDGLGYMPDLWCTSDIAMSAAISLAKELQSGFDSYILKDVELGINPSMYNVPLKVKNKGLVIVDYTVSVSDSNLAKVEKLDNGSLIFTPLSNGKGNVTITYQGSKYNFNFDIRDGEIPRYEPPVVTDPMVNETSGNIYLIRNKSQKLVPEKAWEVNSGGTFSQEVKVFYKDVQTSDFILKSTDEKVKVSKTESGNALIKISGKKSGKYKFTIQCGEEKVEFTWDITFKNME